MNTWIHKLEHDRNDLLDLTLRNKLINFRRLRARGVSVINCSPQELFTVLVTEGRRVSFVPTVEDEEVQQTTYLDDDEDAESKLASSNSDDRNGASRKNRRGHPLQTPYAEKELSKRLRNTYYAARTWIEERGVNTLFIALGMLKWYEAPSSDDILSAPLILVPVEFDRTDIRQRFRARYTGEDIGLNLSLCEKLKLDRGIDLPEVPESVEDIDVQVYFDDVMKAIQSLPRWSVDASSVELGFFSFRKLSMYKDLGDEKWSESDSSVMPSLLEGSFAEQLRYSDEIDIDKVLPPEKSWQVVDADSSQTLAILEVNRGRNLVVHGPPGTGKSQTITNIIAEALARDKTVLFVAEKMAALEVVKRRLDSVELGVACLELHSQKANKRTCLDELQRTLALGKPKVGGRSDNLHMLVQTRDRLNDYSQGVWDPIGKSGVRAYDAFGELLKLDERMRGLSPLPPLRNEPIGEWSRIEFQKRVETASDMQRRLKEIGIPAEHVFWGSGHVDIPPMQIDQVRDESREVEEIINLLQLSSGELAQHLGVVTPGDAVEAGRLVQAARRVLASPSLCGIDVRANDWSESAATIAEGLRVGRKMAEIHHTYDRLLIPEAWQQDVLGIRAALGTYGHKWWRFLSGPYRRAKLTLAGLCREKSPKGLEASRDLVEAILEMQRTEPLLTEQKPLLTRLFASHWQDRASDWEYLLSSAEWLIDFHKSLDSQELPSELLVYLADSLDRDELSRLCSEVERHLEKHAKAVEALVESVSLDEKRRFGNGDTFRTLSFSRGQEIAHAWCFGTDKLRGIADYNYQADALVQQGLNELADISSHWPGASEHLVDLLQRARNQALVARAYRLHPELAHFDAGIHQNYRDRFSTSDKQQLELNRQRLALQHWNRLPHGGAGGQMDTLRREFHKRRRHLPIRKLMTQAGHAIQKIKPVFMMSPLSIATFLPARAIGFDLVIFDEASQIKPVDAFGAILRGRQTVVVGDERQLPPTSFFDRQDDEDEDDLEETSADMQSILGLFCAQSAPEKMLRWHYRSRHESLIAVSNHEFYENRLVVFPGPDESRKEKGLIYHYLPDAVYDRGRSRTNIDEAKEVAKAVLHHARNSPELTLGVAAFSVSQRQMVDDQLWQLRLEDPSCEDFFHSHPEEPFFVKNLENVQGDERDVILISIGYGKAADGSLQLNFGPLNKDGGERRLNVLITRARHRCEVFTSLTADDIDLSRAKARGVEALKVFLQYARDGRLDMSVPTGAEPDSPFEEAVASALRGRGYRVEPQFGSSSYRIDLAILDDEHPGRHPLLGIECDGATYHSAQSARDRDRLRQEVLEGLGWTIKRIWSTDWFTHPGRELDRIEDAIKAAKASLEKKEPNSIQVHTIPNSRPTVEREEPKEVPADQSEAQEYRLARLRISTGGIDLYLVSRAQMATWVRNVVSRESPVHIDEVARRIANAVGVKRVGSRIRLAIDAATRAAARRNVLRRRGDFLWAIGKEKQLSVRNRAKLPMVSRKIEMIAPEEIALAIQTVVAAGCGMKHQDIPQAVCRRFGLRRTTEATSRAIDAEVRRMLSRQQLVVDHGGFLCSPEE